jgi:dsDNA-binding SOS-regulon protein
MAVEVRYHVIRDGKEVAMYTTKKEADEHDKMLNIADNLSQFIKKAETVSLDEEVLEELTIYMAKHRDTALTILRGIKVKKAPQMAAEESPPKAPKKEKGKKAKRKSKAA